MDSKAELIDLEISKTAEKDRLKIIPLTKSLPYYKSSRGEYYHRVRYGNRHECLGIHYAIIFWCGNSGFISNDWYGRPKGSLHSRVPDDGVLCATCEGRAIGAGMNGSRRINGRNVMYSPKRKKC